MSRLILPATSARSFTDGSNTQGLVFGSPAIWSNARRMTLLAIVKAKAIPSFYGVILTRETSSLYGWSWYLSQSLGGISFFQYYSGGNDLNYAGTTYPALNEWSVVTLSVDPISRGDNNRVFGWWQRLSKPSSPTRLVFTVSDEPTSSTPDADDSGTLAVGANGRGMVAPSMNIAFVAGCPHVALPEARIMRWMKEPYNLPPECRGAWHVGQQGLVRDQSGWGINGTHAGTESYVTIRTDGYGFSATPNIIPTLSYNLPGVIGLRRA